MKRERSRSRFAVCLAAAACLSLLAGCGVHYGQPIAELPTERGWQPLPIASWLLNDGVEARAMSLCPRDSCIREGFAALLAFEGSQADAMERDLAADPASLARHFAKPPPTAGARPNAPAAKPRMRPAKRPETTTRVVPYREEGADGLLVEIAARTGSKRAATAILSGRQAGVLILAVAISTDPDAARAMAASTWRSR